MRAARQTTVCVLVSLATALASCGGDKLVLPKDTVPAVITIVKGNGQTGTVGVPLTDSLIVRVTDASNRPVESQPVAFSVTSGGGSITSATATTNADGRAGTRWVLGSGAGQQGVQAKVTGAGAPANLVAAFTATANASAAAKLAPVGGDHQSGTAGSPLTDSIVVVATDAADNPVAGVSVGWTAGGGGSVSAPIVLTGPDGRSAVKRTLGVTAGPQTTVATATGLTGSPVTFTATAAVGAAGQLTISRQPSATAQSGSAFAQVPAIQLVDGGGNPVTSAGIAVTVAIATAPGTGASLIGATTVATNSQGIATFTGLGISGPAGPYSLSFSGVNLTGVTSAVVTLAAGAPSRLMFGTQPSDAAAGATITPAVTVSVEDVLGNVVSGATNAVTLAFGANPGGAALGGTRTVNAVNGIATFSSLTVNAAGVGYTLVASTTSPSLTSSPSNPFTISAGGATTIAAASATSQSATAGAAVATPPAVKVTDASGNGVAGVNVTFAVTAGGGSVSGATQTTSSSGIATVGSWTLGTAAGVNTVQGTAAGLTGSPVTFSATGQAGSAGQLTITTQPSSAAQSGVALSQQPAIQLRDGNGNPVAQAGKSVSAQIASGPTGTLSNATATTDATGLATFSGLTISGPGGAYTLSFGGVSLTGVTSGTVTVGSGSALRLAITTQPSAAPQNAIAFPTQPVIQLEDGSGNAVGQAGVSIQAFLQGGSATLSGTTTVSTNSSGVASFTDLVITGPVGSYTILFVSSGLTSVTSSAMALAGGSPSAGNSTVSASSPITAGGSASTVSVVVKDGSGNPLSGQTVSLAVSGTGNSITQPAAATDVNGSTSGSFTSTVAESKVVTATVGGTVVISQQPTVVVNAASSSTSLALTAGTDPSAAGAPITFTATVTVGTGTPTGTVAFNDGATLLGTSSLSGGSATLSPSLTAAGAHSITATYSGDATFGGSASTALSHTIDPGPPDAGQSSVAAATPVASGTPSTVTVTVKDQFGNPVSGSAVALSAAPADASTFTAAAPTDASGVTTSSFTPAAVTVYTITATADGVAIAQTASVDSQ